MKNKITARLRKRIRELEELVAVKDRNYRDEYIKRQEHVGLKDQVHKENEWLRKVIEKAVTRCECKEK